MDYRGQKLSEYIYAILTILCGGIGWIVGYQQGSFMLTFYGWCIGLGLSLLLCIPDWPMFNRNKVIWSDEVGSISAEKAASASKSKPKKVKKVAEVKSN